MVVQTAVWFKLSSVKVSHLILYRLRNAASLFIRCFLLYFDFHCELGMPIIHKHQSIELNDFFSAPRSTAFFTSSPFFSFRTKVNLWTFLLSPRPRQVISAINIPLSVMLGPVLACRLVRIYSHSKKISFLNLATGIDSWSPRAWFWDSFSFRGYWYSRIYNKIDNTARISLYPSRSTN